MRLLLPLGWASNLPHHDQVNLRIKRLSNSSLWLNIRGNLVVIVQSIRFRTLQKSASFKTRLDHTVKTRALAPAVTVFESRAWNLSVHKLILPEQVFLSISSPLQGQGNGARNQVPRLKWGCSYHSITTITTCTTPTSSHPRTGLEGLAAHSHGAHRVSHGSDVWAGSAFGSTFQLFLEAGTRG